MKGTFSERPKKVKKAPVVAEETADTKRQKKKAAKEQARIQQQNPGAPNMLAPGFGNVMAPGKKIACISPLKFSNFVSSIRFTILYSL